MSTNTKTHYRNCNLCEAMCGIVIKTEQEKIVSIRGDQKDPFSKGYICPKAVALQDIHNDPERLKQPLRKTSTGWEKISWNKAFTEVATNIKKIRHKYGRHAVSIYLGNPNVHNYGALLYGLPFLKSLRTRNRFSATSIDQLPHHLVAYTMFGHQLFIPIPDIDHTDFLLIIGGNPLASNGSIMSAAGMPDRLKAISKRGGKVVVIDPRRTETAIKADKHHFIRPGTDVFLLLSLLHVIYQKNWIKMGKLAEFCLHSDKIAKLVDKYSPETVADLTGIKAQQIYQLAHDLAHAEKSVCYGRLGVSIQEFGAVSQWLIMLINIVTGNLDCRGGLMFTKPAFDLVSLSDKIGDRGHFKRWNTSVRGLPEFGGELPVAAFAEEILTEGERQIKSLITLAGNPILSTPNGKQLEKAFSQLEFMVSVDFYLNETTQYADIILPPTGPLEHEHYDIIFNALAVRNTAKYSPAVFKKPLNTRHDWEILMTLQHKLAMINSGKSAMIKWIKSMLTPERILALGIALGPYGFFSSSKLSLKKIKKQIHGVDLGPLQPCLPKKLMTKGKTIDLTPDIFVEDLKRVEEKFANQSTAKQLLLIGRRHLRSNNSWLHNSLRLVKGKNRCTVWLHPNDAKNHEITQGEVIRVGSRVGSIDIEAEITEDIMPGVVSIPHGWGHHRSGAQLTVARKHAGVSINDITDHLAVDALCGNAAVNGLPVYIERITTE